MKTKILGVGNSGIQCAGCELTDHLEGFAVQNKKLRIVYNSGAEVLEVIGQIVDIVIVNRVEFLLLKTGDQIAVKNLVEIHVLN